MSKPTAMRWIEGDMKEYFPERREGDTDDEYLASCLQYVLAYHYSLTGALVREMILETMGYVREKGGQVADRVTIPDDLASLAAILACQQAAVIALVQAMPRLHGDALLAVERTTDELVMLLAKWIQEKGE